MWLNLILLTLGLLFFYMRKQFRYWKDRGVPGPEPVFIFGNIFSALIGRKSMTDLFDDIYRNYSDCPFVGVYKMSSPSLIIRDPELIKNITIKDFKHFQNNDFHVDKDVDKIFGRNPFVLKGEEWKAKRAQLTPCFTAGKIKAMFPMLEEVSHRMVKYIDEKSSNGKGLFEAREICVRFTLDNVAACAFGLDGRCFLDECSMFRKLADDFLSPGSFESMKIFLLAAMPFLNKIFKVKLVSDDVENQLLNMVKDTMKQRRENNIVRNDFLESVSQLYQSNHPEDELNITAQAASFFADGYETSSRVMSFILFELAAHPNCQKKLRQEINKHCEKSGGKITYEILQDMPYLEACINESMRKNPIVGGLGKVCTERYTYTCTDPDYKNLTVTIEPDMTIILPVGSLHHDEKYFKNPDEYIPERFLDKTEYNRNCFLPFGEGPRACLGFRFGLTQIKVGVAQIIRNFELSVNSKTKLPLEFDKWFFMLCPIGGLWLDFKRIPHE